MCCSFALLALVWLVMDQNGELFVLSARTSKMLVVFLWVTSLASAVLAMTCDRATRVAAVVVLLCLFALFFPPFGQ
jgi:hypothetical protein